MVGFGGLYEVSSEGRVRSISRVVVCSDGRCLPIRGRLLRTALNRNGYLSAQIWRGNRHYPREVHVLVAAAFIGPRPEGQQVRHYDGDRANARASNLSYGTPSDNFEDALRHGTATRAEDNGRALLSNADARCIRTSKAQGVDLAVSFGVSPQTICNIRKGRRYACA